MTTPATGGAPAADGDANGRSDIQAVSRVSRILGLFNVDRTELVTADVALRLGLNRTTTHRYLTSMVAVGLLEPGSRHSSYVVGPLATRLGAMATGSSPALAEAPRHMPALADELGATVALSLWASTGPMVVHVAEPRVADAVLTVRVGTVLGVESAQGAVFAAYLPRGASRIEVLRARLDRARQEEFDRTVAAARRDGVVIVRHTDVGVVAVAAPIFDPSGICASIAAVGLAGSATEAAVPERVERVRAAADRMSTVLGGERPTSAE
ncbi:IclR family transcriptional regulator [Pseudonocardia thermophila]|jgi:Transcriptional regulator|uniref:IclR family transcriptional regulator n=1 Tax=Pseudonocardia thermophila TaxID=1848 RepID=UPI00248F25F7|nr:helix-turn-helix domain-containing protein [Pseudonocardia thermophila]